MGNAEHVTVGRLTRYMEHEFVATTATQRRWLHKTRAHFARMDGVDAQCAKLVVHASTRTT